MTVEFRGGKLPPQPEKPRLRFAAFARVTSPERLPAAVNWLGQFDYPMYGNDQYGDCVFAGQGHEIIARTGFASPERQFYPTTDQVLAQYHAVTGFDPGRPDTDQGAVLQDALNAWRKAGFAGTSHRILAFAEVDHRKPDEVLAAVDLFGALSVGVDFPDTAMDQFDAGQPWTVRPGARSLGGHAVHAGKLERRGDGGLRVWVVTWGRVQEVSWEWWLTYVDEAWVTITEDWLSSAGSSPVGLNLQALAEQFQALTGTAVPLPDPEPVPVPDSPDAPTAADLELWAGIQKWVRSPGRRWCGGPQARQLLAWAKAKGLTPGGS